MTEESPAPVDDASAEQPAEDKTRERQQDLLRSVTFWGLLLSVSSSLPILVLISLTMMIFVLNPYVSPPPLLRTLPFVGAALVAAVVGLGCGLVVGSRERWPRPPEDSAGRALGSALAVALVWPVVLTLAWVAYGAGVAVAAGQLTWSGLYGDELISVGIAAIVAIVALGPVPLVAVLLRHLAIRRGKSMILVHLSVWAGHAVLLGLCMALLLSFMLTAL